MRLICHIFIQTGAERERMVLEVHAMLSKQPLERGCFDNKCPDYAPQVAAVAVPTAVTARAGVAAPKSQ